jgi:uncharacterized SAM-binding protein YcdF (DUF218 family)
MRIFSVANILRFLFLILSLYGFIVFLRPVFIGILNFGNAVGMLFFAVSALVCIFWPSFTRLISRLMSKRMGKIGVIGFLILVVVCFVWATVLSVIMIRNIRSEALQRSTVIVLGCKVNGEEPSLALARRIDAAIEYLEKYPESVVIVSGGQGPDEGISEAEAMRRRMTVQGIAPERIFMEDQSTSTYENLTFSMQIMKDMNLRDDTIIITEGYHLTRALYMAESLGMDAQGLSAKTVRWLLPTAWVREWFALTASYLSI